MLENLKITAEFVRNVLHYDPDTGVLMWKIRPNGPKKWNTKYAGTQAGNVAVTGYRYITFKGKSPIGAHRLAWVHFYGEWPSFPVDHINGVRDDNRIANLRPANATINAVNKAIQRNNTSGFPGVTFEKRRGKYRARLTINRVNYDVGFFATAEEASAAREKLALRIHGEFSPDDPYRRKYFHHRDAKRSEG